MQLLESSEDNDEYTVKLTFEELTLIEEGLLFGCGYWNKMHIDRGVKYEDITDKRDIRRNELHDEFFELIK
jgi:hypothetical protein